MTWFTRPPGFAGKVSLVTGAASGLGLALAEELCRRGGTVLMGDQDELTLTAACAQMEKRGWSVEPVLLDVADFASVEAAVEGAVQRHGRLDYLFNNAGIARLGEIGELDLEHWRRIVDVNFMGVVHGCKAAFKAMAAHGGGHIVNTASVAGMAGFPMLSSYAATKAAVINLSTSLRAEGRAVGVRVSVLCPGCFQSGIYHKYDGVPRELPPNAAAALGRVPMLDTHSAALMALRGVERNQALIVFPGWAYWSSLVWRLAIRLSNPIHRLALWKMRKIRAQS